MLKLWRLSCVLATLIVTARCGKPRHLEVLDSLLKGYDRRATPSNHLNNATSVTCELYIRSFGSIDPSSMDYQVDLYLRQTWNDERLYHKEIVQPLDLNDPDLVKAIWKPEVYFPNAKQAEFQFVTVPNVLVRINPHGEILYMLRLKLLFSCMMELSKFPLDTQVCTMEIASFSKTVKELELQWKPTHEPIKMYRNLRMPQFQMQKIVAATCQEAFQIGNYSCLVAEFHMQRAVGFHLVQSYLPTILIVAISWVSFWMDVDSVPARTTLGVTTLLTVSTKSSGIQCDLPQVSYVKAIDVWMGACTAFVFCSLMEFTLVNYLWRKSPGYHPHLSPHLLHPREAANGNGRHHHVNQQQFAVSTCQQKPLKKNTHCHKHSSTVSKQRNKNISTCDTAFSTASHCARFENFQKEMPTSGKTIPSLLSKLPSEVPKTGAVKQGRPVEVGAGSQDHNPRTQESNRDAGKESCLRRTSSPSESRCMRLASGHANETHAWKRALTEYSRSADVPGVKDAPVRGVNSSKIASEALIRQTESSTKHFSREALLIRSNPLDVTDRLGQHIPKGMIRNFTLDDIYSMHAHHVTSNANGDEVIQKMCITSSLSNPVDIRCANQSVFDVKTTLTTCDSVNENNEKDDNYLLQLCDCLTPCGEWDSGCQAHPCHNHHGDSVPCELDDCSEDADLLHSCETNDCSCSLEKPCISSKTEHLNTSNKMWARKIDEYCRGTFPLLFGIFNAFYWTHYLYK